MSIPHIPEPVLLVMGILRTPSVPLHLVRDRITESFGPIQAYTDEIPFNFTSYYKQEMGAGILRSYYSFVQPVSPEDLADIKRATNALESAFLQEQNRMVNLDPGLLTMHSLILASCKDFSHRIYLRDGIFAEVTLLFSKGHFTALPWTYPDYQHPETIEFFEQQRTEYIKQRRKTMSG
jgi:hypothetical protein